MHVHSDPLTGYDRPKWTLNTKTVKDMGCELGGSFILTHYYGTISDILQYNLMNLLSDHKLWTSKSTPLSLQRLRVALASSTLCQGLWEFAWVAYFLPLQTCSGCKHGKALTSGAF